MAFTGCGKMTFFCSLKCFLRGLTLRGVRKVDELSPTRYPWASTYLCTTFASLLSIPCALCGKAFDFLDWTPHSVHSTNQPKSQIGNRKSTIESPHSRRPSRQQHQPFNYQHHVSRREQIVDNPHLRPDL